MRRAGISFYVDPDLYDRFRARCEKEGRKVSQVVEGYMRWELGEDTNLRTSRELSLRIIANMDNCEDRPQLILVPGMFTELLKDDRNSQEGVERFIELQLAGFRYTLLKDFEDIITWLLNPDAQLMERITKRDYLSALWHLYALAYRDLTLEFLERPEKVLPAIEALKDQAKKYLDEIVESIEIKN